MKISFIKGLSEEAQAKMEAGLLEYEISHGIDVAWSPFSLELRNEENEIIGVLDAFSSYSSVYINDLWVDKRYRGQGLGRQLIEELEKRFQHSGFDNINTVSCAFQAPEFYQKCGFQVEFVRENKTNPKLSVTFLVKFLEQKKDNT